VYLATHVVARALHDLDDAKVPVAAALAGIEATRARLAADPALGRVWSGLDAVGPEDLLASALHAWGSWHRRQPVVRDGDTVEIVARELLVFYRNRTAHIPA
jgi:hypothetical protein